MDDNKKNEEALSESEIQEKKLRAAKAARKRKKRIKSIIGWLVVILIVSLVLIWFLKMKKDSEAQIEALKNRNTQVEAVVEKSVYNREIDISGYVVPYDTLEAKFRSTGAVTGVYVSEGDYVKEGQILATIDDTQQRMNLQDIENQIAEARLTGSVKTLEILEMRKKIRRKEGFWQDTLRGLLIRMRMLLSLETLILLLVMMIYLAFLTVLILYLFVMILIILMIMHFMMQRRIHIIL